jgi:hypothetical protein
MKRDMELIRMILIEIEKQPSYLSEINLNFAGYSSEDIHYHVMLLCEAGLIVAHDQSSLSDIYWIPERLTWEGHEFLEASRDNNIWNKAKEIMSKGGGFVFDVAKPLLIKLIEHQISGYLP